MAPPKLTPWAAGGGDEAGAPGTEHKAQQRPIAHAGQGVVAGREQTPRAPRGWRRACAAAGCALGGGRRAPAARAARSAGGVGDAGEVQLRERSEEHTSEL